MAEEANKFAEEQKLLIVSAQLTYSGMGRTYEEPVLVVVYEKVKAPRKLRNKPGDVTDGDV